MTSAPADRAFDAVLCDLDNVIRFYDTVPLAALERASGLPEGTTTDLGYAPETDLPLLLGRITPDAWVESIAAGLTERVGAERAHELGWALADAPFRADEEVVSLLRRARTHVPLVLVTNATLQLEAELALLSLSDLADAVVSSAVEQVAKPDPAIYRIAAERAGVPMERCLFVDDTQENIDAAAALGMTTALYRQPDDLRRALGVLRGGGGSGPMNREPEVLSGGPANAGAVLRHGDTVERPLRPRRGWPSDLADPEGAASGALGCHNDACLENVVFRDGRAAALIDFDLAAPGRPVWDVAMAARHWAPMRGRPGLGPPTACASWPTATGWGARTGPPCPG
ncbi:HAD-IA family hydrolase [Streptomyces globisporus]|uniref:HAD-IA family hydrolase n=1 Tax=Streptomyces globisporus TaxID=1908 RepID=UPI0036FE9245